ncbi:MAG TPA: lysophospholipid acyltransferase family protein [Solirubrobacteraceae bacterium]|nr:lysophospholipid acyltransferase family protein [Solirubrobacteraceae bacterium]
MALPAQHPVAAGMTAYVRLRLRPHVFGLEHLRLEPGTIVAPNHRSDNDVPVLVTTLYRRWARAVARGAPWPTFATDDHAFLRGFLAGYPEGIPLWLRRLLWPIRVGGVLERNLQCVPVRDPNEMRLVELLRADSRLALDGQLPPELRAALARRAAECGRPAPGRAEDVLRGMYADLLWTPVDHDEVARLGERWREHARAAVHDFRRLAETLEAGGIVVIYPEGELSPDGRIGPLRAGVASLARRGRARWVQPVAISYDPLAGSRPRVYVSIAPRIVPTPGRLTRDVADALRRATPLTAGQIVAWQLGRDGTRLDDGAADWIARARADERPVEPALLGRRRLAALREARRRALRRGAADPVIAGLATELEDAHAR